MRGEESRTDALLRRGFDLLWRRDMDRHGRGPRAALSIDQIADAAIAIADAHGIGALSMRRLAERLGVGTMSLYRYVPGKAELVDLMLDRVSTEAIPVRTPDWRQNLEAFARASRALHERHPWVLRVEVQERPALGPNILGTFEWLLDVLSATGLSGPEMVAVANLLDAYVRGASRRAVDAAQAERETGISTEQWWTERAAFWDEYYPSDRYPHMTRLYMAGAYDQPEDDFEFGLRCVLDGVEALVAATIPLGS